MSEYFERWLDVKERIERNTAVSDYIKDTMMDRGGRLINHGTHNAIYGVGSLDEIQLVLRKPLMRALGRFVAAEAVQFELEFGCEQGVIYPHFVGLVCLGRNYALLTEDMTAGGVASIRNISAERIALRTWPDGRTDRVFIDPNINFPRESTAKKYLDSALVL
jgi:hypothetical protein